MSLQVDGDVGRQHLCLWRLGKQTQHTGSVANPWGYVSGYLDTTGLIKFVTRYYEANFE